MPNLTNKEEWVKPTNIPEHRKNFVFDEECYCEMLSVLANSTTLSEAQSGIDHVFDSTTFLRNL